MSGLNFKQNANDKPAGAIIVFRDSYRSYRFARIDAKHRKGCSPLYGAARRKGCLFGQSSRLRRTHYGAALATPYRSAPLSPSRDFRVPRPRATFRAPSLNIFAHEKTATAKAMTACEANDDTQKLSRYFSYCFETNSSY